MGTIPWLPGTGTDPANPVTDPVFRRDIGFFLFELPFLRLIQAVVNGVLLAALFLTIGRYVLGALRGTFDFNTPIRVHLAVLGGLYLLSVAAGYQLDKYELVYSTQGVATGVSYTDVNARFFAFDADRDSPLSGALLVGRRVHAAALAARARDRRVDPRDGPACRRLPAVRPALHRGAQPVRPGAARTSPTTSR